MSLENHLKALIKHNGLLSVVDFMNEALLNPKYGYYQKKVAIGKDADFITAPEISQVFGEIITAYLLNHFASKDFSKNFTPGINLVEMGAGRGTLIKDILISLKKLADSGVEIAKYFLQYFSFNIIEINPVLRAVQKENLQEITDKAKIKINWYNDFDEFSASNRQEIYFIANELFDCFAVNQFEMFEHKSSRQKLWHEIKIGVECLNGQEKLKFYLADFNEAIHQLVNSLIKNEILDDNVMLTSGAIFEYSFQAANFMTSLSNYIKNNSGIALIFDYGYIKNKLVSTVQAIKNHQKTEVLEEIGDCDLTALVNFSMLDKIAKSSGLNSSLITQREFLISLGVEDRRKILLKNKDDDEQLKINQSINRLIAKDQMGELFKCMILWS